LRCRPCGLCSRTPTAAWPAKAQWRPFRWTTGQTMH